MHRIPQLQQAFVGYMRASYSLCHWPSIVLHQNRRDFPLYARRFRLAGGIMAGSSKTGAFDNWWKGKPQLPRFITQLSVVCAKSIFEALRMSQGSFRCADGVTRTLYDAYELPSRSEWLKLYFRRHTIFFRALPAMGIDNMDVELYSTFRQAIFLMKNRPEKIKEEIQRMEKMEMGELGKIIDCFRKYPLEITEQDIRDEEDESFTPAQEKFLSSSSMLFMFRVMMPCFIFYNTFPSMLIRKARKGNLNAICNLLKIDKAVIYDKKISKIIYRIQALQPATFRNRIAKALAAPIPKICLKKLKNNLGGFVWPVFGDFFKLSTTDIHFCFDAHAQAIEGKNVDSDIQTDEEAHRKALARYGKDWRENYMRLEPDMNPSK